jgi:hypothetical protein
VVLIEHNPWLMVVGSDVPTLVLYEDGLVIYHRVKERRAEPLQARLTPDRAQALAAELVDIGFFGLPLYKERTMGTDQPTVDIYLRSGTRWHLASVYGASRHDPAVYGDGTPGPVFSRAYHRLATFEADGAVPWKPEQIEVMLWDFGDASQSVPWPTAIPRPDASVKPPKGSVYKYFMDGKYGDEVRGFQETLHGTTAVELNGFRWKVGYRRRIPEEDYFQKVKLALHSEGR